MSSASIQLTGVAIAAGLRGPGDDRATARRARYIPAQPAGRAARNSLAAATELGSAIRAYARVNHIGTGVLQCVPPPASAELTAAMGRLVGQLSSSARAPTEAELQEVVDSSATRLLVARDEDDNIVGSLTLALFRIPTGMRAWVEDPALERPFRR
jgi:hypothetical protein